MGSPWSVSLLRHAALPGRQVHPVRALGSGAGRQTISIASPKEKKRYRSSTAAR